MKMQKIILMKNFNIILKINYIYYKYVYLSPYIIYKGLYLYRFILGLVFIYCFIRNNLIFIESVFDNFLDYYVQEFSDFFVVCMDSLNEDNPYGEGSSNSGPTGKGPSDNNTGGLESTAENENSNKRKSTQENLHNSSSSKKNKTTNNKPKRKYAKKISELTREEQPFKMRFRRLPKTRWPKYRYFDRDKYKWIYPEKFHMHPPKEVMASNTMRVYEEGHIRYTYFCENFHESDRYCKITYPDGTSLFMFDKSRVMKHIELHHWNIYLGYKMEPKFFYGDYYKEHFSIFKQNKINELKKKKSE